MKNILLSFVLVLLSFAGYSTSRGIEIINQSRCDIYLQLRGAKECGDCEVHYTSCLISVPGGGTALFPNTTTICGFPSSPVFVHSALIYSGPRHCQPLQTWLIGEPKCNLPTMINFFAMDQNCRILCERLTARWQSGGCQGIARLIITP